MKMSVESKIEKIKNLLSDVMCEVTWGHQEDDEEGNIRLDNVCEQIDTLEENLYNLEKAYEKYTDYLEMRRDNG